MRIRFSYACAQLICLPFAEGRLAAPTNPSAFTWRFLSELRTPTQGEISFEGNKISAVIKTLKNAVMQGRNRRFLLIASRSILRS
jgi:hypothetical protein